MSKDFSKPSTTRRLPNTVMVAVWIFAIGAPSLVLHANRVDDARREGEDRVLTQVAATLRSPSTDRHAVMSLLERNQRELTDTRYLRTCKRLGIPMNWNMLFVDIGRRGKAEQAKAAKIIAEECRLEPGASLKREQIYLSLGMIQFTPMEHTVPIPMPMRASVD